VIYIKTSMIFRIYHKRCMFFSNEELLGYKFKIGNCKKHVKEMLW